MREKQKSPMISNNITVNKIYQLFTYRVKNTFVLQGISLCYLFSVRSKMQQNEKKRKQSSYRVNPDAKNSYTTISSIYFFLNRKNHPTFYTLAIYQIWRTLK